MKMKLFLLCIVLLNTNWADYYKIVTKDKKVAQTFLDYVYEDEIIFKEKKRVMFFKKEWTFIVSSNRNFDQFPAKRIRHIQVFGIVKRIAAQKEDPMGWGNQDMFGKERYRTNISKEFGSEQIKEGLTFVNEASKLPFNTLHRAFPQELKKINNDDYFYSTDQGYELYLTLEFKIDDFVANLVGARTPSSGRQWLRNSYPESVTDITTLKPIFSNIY